MSPRDGNTADRGDGARSARWRLDDAWVARGLPDSRARARALVMAGDVTLNDAVVTRAGAPVRPEDVVALVAPPRFVSRGGEKLTHALAEFGVEVGDVVAADLGASTGGFTDCLLQAGAARVYAVDVGYGLLAQKLRDDLRVVVVERTNARYLERLPEPVDLVTIDVSFISLSLVLPVAARLLRPGGVCLPLVKPQFEAGRADVGKGGVVRDPAVHRRVLAETMARAIEAGFGVRGAVASPLRGPAGNVEFLLHLVLGADSAASEPLIAAALAGLPS